MDETTREDLRYNVYQTFIEGKPAFITFCETLTEYTREELPPNICLLSVPIKNGTDEGLPRAEEFDVLEAIEDDVLAAMSDHDTLCAGRVTVDHERVFYIYSAMEEDDFFHVIETIAEKHGYDLGGRHAEDPDLEYYFDDLYPSEIERNIMNIDAILELLRENGDALIVPREITHWSYFPTEAIALDYTVWLKAQGYTFETPYPIEGDEESWSVRFSHHSRPERTDLFLRTQELREHASELGGSYDGWETQVIARSA